MNILIADGDQISRELLAARLKSINYNVRLADDGEAAWNICRLEHIDILITDWIMPRFNGIELCKMIRSQLNKRYIYIIMLASKGGKQNFIEGMEAGADDFLSKPVDDDIIKSRIHVAERILELKTEITTLQGFLPTCSYCKKIRNQEGAWEPIEQYISFHSDTMFSHVLCPDCAQH